MTETREEKTAYLAKIFAEEEIPVPEGAAESLADFYALLDEKNRVMNLTAIRDFEEAAVKHFADSLALLKYMEIPEGAKLIDVGSGAGFPGIPLAVCRGDITVTSLDSTGKKIRFQEEAAEKLNLANLLPVSARAEDLAQKDGYRESFDVCTSRAVAALPVLAEYCLPFVKTGGVFAAYKSVDTDAELKDAGKAIRKLGGKVEKICRFSLAGAERTILIIRKTGRTPAGYPRKNGIPAKKPIR